MPNEQIYTTELARFRNKYNMPEYDLKTLMEVDQKFQHLNSFLFESSTTANPAAQFVNLMSRTLAMYFESSTSLRTDGKYMSGFYPQEFLRDFEKLASAKYFSELNDAEEPQRKKYDGARKRDIKQILINNFKDLNKTLPTLWAEKLKKGTMTQNELLGITSNVMDTMDGVIIGDDAPLEDKIINVVAAYEAMKQVRESRTGFWGWLWKFIFRERNEIEQTNLETFESQVNQLREKGYSVDKISADLTGKTVLGLEVESRDKARETQAIEPVVGVLVGKVKTIIAQPDFKKDFVNEVIEALPKNNTVDANMQKAIFTGMLESSFIDKIQQFNQKFDEQEVKTEEHIKAGAKEVFKKAYTAAQALGYSQPIERLTVAQLLTDKIMKNFSPVALESETYAQFANGYVLKNANELLNDVEAIHAESEDMFKDNAREITFQKAEKAYDDMTREKVEIIDANNSVNEQVAPQVHQNPQINALSIDKK